MGYSSNRQYNTDVRSFAFTLSYYSPRAYRFIRAKFENNLPHPSTMRKWYANSMANGKPGISESSISMLRTLIEDLKTRNEKLYVTLVFDEMAINPMLTWSESQKKFIGFINYGKYDSDKRLPLASQAIVFMVNGINASFNLPVAHYFINALDTTEKMFLLLAVMKALTDAGVSIAMITYDGLATNITTMESLGASFDLENMQPYINNPVDDSKIFIMMDPPHMMKLMRNYIGSTKQMFDSRGRSIEWKHYEKLEMLRQSNELVTHKLTKHHLNYEDKKMKVSLAVQLLSQSVASSMEHLMNCGHTDFRNSEGTIEFTRRMNNLFDILNSRNDADGEFKQSLCPANKYKIFAYLKECREY